MSRAKPVCPACLRPIASEPQSACKRCGTWYHQQCKDPLGCVVTGCAKPARPRAPSEPPASFFFRGVPVATCVLVLSIAASILFTTRWSNWTIAATCCAYTALLICTAMGGVHDLVTGAAAGRYLGTIALISLSAGFGVTTVTLQTAGYGAWVSIPTSLGLCCGGLLGLGGLVADHRKKRASCALALALVVGWIWSGLVGNMRY